MITHYETIQYAALSFLGIISLVAAIVTMLYTTAADALVKPQLKFGDWEARPLVSYVTASFSNVEYLKNKWR